MPEPPSSMGYAERTCWQVDSWLHWACWWSHPLPCSFAQSRVLPGAARNKASPPPSCPFSRRSVPLPSDLALPVAPGCMILWGRKNFPFLPSRFFDWSNNYKLQEIRQRVGGECMNGAVPSLFLPQSSCGPSDTPHPTANTTRSTLTATARPSLHPGP